MILFKNDNGNINTYFGLSKYIQLIKKLKNIISLINQNCEDKPKLLFDINYDFGLIGINTDKKIINLDKLFSSLQNNSRVFSFFKFIKHILSLFIDKLNYTFVKTNLIQYYNNKKLEEIIVILFKRY